MNGEIEEILREFRLIEKLNPVIFLDYDGTLVPIVMDPDKAYPSSFIKEKLKGLSERYELYIISGRSMADMERFLGKGLNIIALHGAICRIDGVYLSNVDNFDHYVKTCNEIYQDRERYLKEYTGLRIYNKNGNILFHFGLMKSGREKLINDVKELAQKVGMDVYMGKMIIELRIPGINKGMAINALRKGRPSLIAGDDATDEEAFMMNRDCILVHVGPGNTVAKHILKSTEEMEELLSGLISLD